MAGAGWELLGLRSPSSSVETRNRNQCNFYIWPFSPVVRPETIINLSIVEYVHLRTSIISSVGIEPEIDPLQRFDAHWKASWPAHRNFRYSAPSCSEPSTGCGFATMTAQSFWTYSSTKPLSLLIFRHARKVTPVNTYGLPPFFSPAIPRPLLRANFVVLRTSSIQHRPIEVLKPGQPRIS
jgi:hypothetical protein